MELVIERWKYGYVFIGNFVNEKTINYISKYMLKDDLNNREFTGKVLTSAGMGKKYFERGDWKFNRYNGKNTREYYVIKNGTRAMMPRYYKDKIYSEEEKELLWLQKLDKGDTWVMGEKCKIDSDSEARIDEIIAKIPSEKQQYHVSKAYEDSLKAAKELSEKLAAKTDQERLNLKVQEHVLFKEFDKLVSEVDGVNLDNDQKTIIKNSLQKSINSQMYLNTMKAMEAAANAKFTNENIS